MIDFYLFKIVKRTLMEKVNNLTNSCMKVAGKCSTNFSFFLLIFLQDTNNSGQRQQITSSKAQSKTGYSQSYWATQN